MTPDIQVVHSLIPHTCNSVCTEQWITASEVKTYDYNAIITVGFKHWADKHRAEDH